MKRILARLVALCLLGVLAFAPSAWAQGQEVTVTMEDNVFEPANVTVEPGTTVTWVQSGDNPHTTTSYDGLWDSGMIPGGSGQSFSFTFDEPGTYDYFCIPHESIGMVGSVTVTDGAATPSPMATPSPTAMATPTPLPTTGGQSPAQPIIALAAGLVLLVSGGIAVALVRRSVS